MRALLAAQGVEPVLAGCGWSLPGELGVYCAGHPQAYSVGPALGDRHSQYDLWPNPFDQPDAFRGRTFLIVGGITRDVARAFERVEGTELFWYREGGQPVAMWPITVCRGLKGLTRKATGY